MRRPLRSRERPDGEPAARLPGCCGAIAESGPGREQLGAVPAPGGVPALPGRVAGDAGVLDGLGVGEGGHAHHCARGRLPAAGPPRTLPALPVVVGWHRRQAAQEGADFRGARRVREEVRV